MENENKKKPEKQECYEHPFTENEFAIGVALQNEFRIFCLLHKARMIELSLAEHYKDLNETGVTLPDFMQKDPIKQAQEDTVELLCNDRELFEAKYNAAWEKYGARMI